MFTGAGAGAASRAARLGVIVHAHRHPTTIDALTPQGVANGDHDALGQRAGLRAHARQHATLARQGRGPCDGEEVRVRRSTCGRASRPTCCRCRSRSRSPATPPSSASPAWPASKRRSSRTTRRASPSCAQRIRRRSTTCSRCRPSRSTAATPSEITVPRRAGAMTMKGEAYLKHFVLPNFFFHVTTTYALLRHNGVELGKTDFLGAVAAGSDARLSVRSAARAPRRRARR